MIEEEERIVTYGLHAPPSYHDAVSRSLSAPAWKGTLGNFAQRAPKLLYPIDLLPVRGNWCLYAENELDRKSRLS